MNDESESTEARGGTQGDTKKQLLLNLHPFSHGAWAHTNISRISLFGRNLAKATSPRQYERFRAALTEYNEKVRPALENIAHRFLLLQSDSTLGGPLRSHADELARITHTLTLNRRIADEEVQRLEEEIPRCAEGLLSMLHACREHLLRDFRCRPDGILRNIVERRQMGDTSRRIASMMQMADPDQLVVSDEEDFRRVMETLIDGMQGQAGGTTSLVARTAGDRWLLEVKNDKLYLPLHLWREVFVGKGVSGHEELVLVAGILGLYDGDVCVKASNEVAGTTVLLRLRRWRQ